MGTGSAEGVDVQTLYHKPNEAGLREQDAECMSKQGGLDRQPACGWPPRMKPRAIVVEYITVPYSSGPDGCAPAGETTVGVIRFVVHSFRVVRLSLYMWRPRSSLLVGNQWPGPSPQPLWRK